MIFGSLKELIINLLDIILVAVIIYETIILIKGTRTVQMLLGILLVVLLYLIAQYLGMPTITWLLDGFIKYFVLILIILFQNDIRRALTEVGRNPFFTGVSRSEEKQVIDEIVKAAFQMANRRIGALIVIERRVSLKNMVEDAVTLDAKVSSELLVTIFFPKTPLHDGAVVIKEGRVLQAKGILPLSSNPEIPKFLGTRHRAAIGITEQSDAIAIVVSEEEGIVSLVLEGKITRGLQQKELFNQLAELLEVQL